MNFLPMFLHSDIFSRKLFKGYGRVLKFEELFESEPKYRSKEMLQELNQSAEDRWRFSEYTFKYPTSHIKHAIRHQSICLRERERERDRERDRQTDRRTY